jgi:AGZA family xanthine/uracil permease-like MFS transporter
LDAPSTIGLPLVVVGPEFQRLRLEGLSVDDAALRAWHIGCATVFLIGILKALLAFISGVSDHLHPSGKQGALAGIGFALLGLLELTTIVPEPVTGLLSLWLLLVCLVPRASGKPITMPFKLLPGILVSACVGTIVYYIMAAAGISVVPMPTNVTDNSSQTIGHFANFFGDAISQAFQRHISKLLFLHLTSLVIIIIDVVFNRYRYSICYISACWWINCSRWCRC